MDRGTDEAEGEGEEGEGEDGLLTGAASDVDGEVGGDERERGVIEVGGLLLMRANKERT